MPLRVMYYINVISFIDLKLCLSTIFKMVHGDDSVVNNSLICT